MWTGQCCEYTSIVNTSSALRATSRGAFGAAFIYYLQVIVSERLNHIMLKPDCDVLKSVYFMLRGGGSRNVSNGVNDSPGFERLLFNSFSPLAKPARR